MTTMTNLIPPCPLREGMGKGLPSSTSPKRLSKDGKWRRNKKWLILQPLMFEPVNTYLLTERGNPDYQSVLVREYFTPKLHKRMLVGRFVNQFWLWDENHKCWVRLQAKKYHCAAMKKRPAYPFVMTQAGKDGLHLNENFYCHRLMAAVWCPNPDPEHRTQVDHINGDLDDYSQFNLEWVTPEENTRRRWVNYYARKQQLTN